MNAVPHTPIVSPILSPVVLPKVSQLSDADMQAVPAALARAAQSARELAARTGTPLVVARDGKLVQAMIPPSPLKPDGGGLPAH